MKQRQALEIIRTTVKYLQEVNRDRLSTDLFRTLLILENYLSAIIFIIDKMPDAKIEMKIKTKDGKQEKIDPRIDSRYFFHPLISSLKDCHPNSKPIINYLLISTKAFSNTKLPLVLKVQVADIEQQYLKDILEATFMYSTDLDRALIARYNLCKKALGEPDSEIFNDNKHELTSLASGFISKIIQAHVRRGKLLQACSLLKRMLKDAKCDEETKLLIQLLINHSTSFNLLTVDELKDIVSENEHLFKVEELELLNTELNFTPGGMKMQSLSFFVGKLSKESFRDKKAVTTIHFSLPHAYSKDKPVKIQLTDTVSIILSSISNFWEDPIFTLLSNWKIVNIGWSYYCDIEPKNGLNYTHVQVEMDELYIPDFTLTETGHEKVDFKEKEAMMGRTYYPHKEYVTKLFREHFDTIKKFVDIPLNDININLFSNYLVQYFEKTTRKRIAQVVHAITNPDSFSKTSARFLDGLVALKISSEATGIRDLYEMTINTEWNLVNLVAKAFDLLVKDNVELHGDYQYLWGKDKHGSQTPLSEPKIQPYIFNHLRAVFNFMGIQISREAVSANGQIDFLVSFTNSQGVLLKVCCELKLAHGSVEDGITKQLPEYLKGERCSYGHYIVLWFKCDEFDKPRNFETLNDLSKFLENKKNTTKILKTVINCTKPRSPSQL